MTANTTRRWRGSLLFPLAVVAIGIVLLLTNLGIVSTIAWGELVRFWPVLLIILGIDVLLGRPSFRSAVSTLLTAIVIVAVGFAAVYLFGPNAWIVKQQALAYPLDSVASAYIQFDCDRCSIDIDEAIGSANLIEGSIEFGREVRLHQLTRLTDDVLAFSLTVDPMFPLPRVFSSFERMWTIRLHPGIPIDLSVTSDGSIDLDLRALRVQSVDMSAGREPCTLTAPRIGRVLAYISGEDLLIRVPDGVGVRIIGLPSGRLTAPSSYVNANGSWQSPNYDHAAATIDLHLRPPVVHLEVTPLESAPASDPEAT